MAREKQEAGFANARILWLAIPVAAALAAFSAKPAHTGEPDLASDPPTTSLSPDLPVRVEIEKPKPELERGKALYAQRCATCHGRDGTGSGSAARHLNPKPTDLTRGMYKVRSTPQGTSPTDADIFRTLTFGIPGTAMPGWMGLSADDRWQLVFYLKSLAPGFDGRKGEPIVVPEPPPTTLQSIERGRAIYRTLQCFQCHGANGRGDGPSSNKLVDARGDRIYPFDFSRSAKFKGGSSARAIYRTIHTGFDGTPMKSFEGMLTARDTWALVDFIRSLRVDAPKPAVLAESEASTYVARVKSAQEAAKQAQEDARTAQAEAERAREDATAARAILDQMLAQKDAAQREAAERAARQRAERDKAAREKAARAKQAGARAAARRAVLKEARDFYRTRCAACHGARGKGDGPAAPGLKPTPRDFSDPAWQASMSNSKIEKVILLGGPAIGKSGIMPPNPDLKKNPEVLKQLRRMIRGFKRK